MFIYIALLSAFGFTLQNVLMAKHARLDDSLSMSFYRSVCLMFSLSPLLFLVSRDTIHFSIDTFLPILLAGVCSAMSYWLFMHSFKYLPVGISSALRYGLSVFVVTGIAWFYFQEVLSYASIFFMLLLLCGAVVLSLFKTSFQHLDTTKTLLGRGLVTLSGMLHGFGLIMLADSARQLDPYFVGYMWEMAVLLVFLILILIRKRSFKVQIKQIGTQGLLKIFWASSPTLLGTGCYTWASALGPVGIVSAISVSGVLIATLLGVLLYREHLKPIQYFGILLIVLSIVCIKLLV